MTPVAEPCHEKQLSGNGTGTYSRNWQHALGGCQNYYGPVTVCAFCFPSLSGRGSPISLPPSHVECAQQINNLIN